VIDALREELDRRWSELRPGRPRLRGATLLGANRSENLKAVILLFGQDGRLGAVCKVARGPEGEAALRAEYAVLSDLQGIGPPSFLECAPEPLLLEEIGRRLVLVTTPVRGEPMVTRYHTPGHTSDARRVGTDFARAAAWLSRFQRETRSEVVALSEAVDRWYEPVLERYRREIGWGAEEESLFSEVFARVRDLRDVAVPVTAVHGDLWVGNLLDDHGAITGVLDWECGSRAGLPFRDVYKFPTSYGTYLNRAYAGRRGVPGHPGWAAAEVSWSRPGDWRNALGFGYTYFGSGWFPELVRRHVTGLLADLGMSPEVNAVFFPLFLAEQATALDVDEFRQGYASLLRSFAERADATWLWAATPGPRVSRTT